jgi:hypothetical protein
MAEVRRGGGVDREIKVILDPAKMQSMGVTASQINLVLRSQNMNAAGGRAEIAGSEQGVRVLGNAKDAYQLGETQIAIGGGRTIKLGDVATVRDSYGEQRNYSTMDGKQVLSFAMTKAKGYSDVTVYDQAEKEIAKLQKEYPNVHFTKLFSEVEYVRTQYESAMEAMIEGAVLAVIVVFLFLRDVRATLISALAIPLSAIPTFWFMDLMGFSLNFLSLLALSLVAGVLVDDAIVEIENIVRHMRMGKSAYQASIDAADEIGLAVVATTFSIVAVFLPVGLMPGISGQFFKNFGFTVVVRGADQPRRRAADHADDRRLFPQGQGPGASHGEGWLMDRLCRPPALVDPQPLEDGALGGVSLALTIVCFYMLPTTFQPPLNVDSARSRSRCRRARRWSRPSGRQQGRCNPSKEARGRERLRRCRRRQRQRLSDAEQERTMTSVEFERHYAPKRCAIPDARINFPRKRRRRRPRPQRHPGRRRSRQAEPGRARNLIEQMRKLPEIREPRINGDLPRPRSRSSRARSRRRARRDDRGAEPDDPHRDPGRHRPEQRQILAVGPPDPDPGGARRERARESLDDREPAGADRRRRLGAAEAGRRHQLRRRPDQIRRFNQRRRLSIGADLAPGLVSGEAMKKIMDLPR